MEQFDLYRDIAERTDGDIYLGVVGPVRTGKSTFIKRFMDLMVLPNIPNEYKRERTIDELPQSAAGRTIMTTQPKFVPNEAVNIKLDDSIDVNVRLVDCVGYLIDGAMGHTENEQPRMVRTPWHTNDIPFERAAEIGTHKVISDHSTIGVVVTTDGSISEIPRASFIRAEERVIDELKDINKPFVVVLNTAEPKSQDTQKLALSLEEKYVVPVITCDVLNMANSDVNHVLETVLYEFPVKEINIDLPKWVQALPKEHYLVNEIIESVKAHSNEISRMRENNNMLAAFDESKNIEGITLSGVRPGEGAIDYTLSIQHDLFYKILGEECGCDIKGDYHLVALMRDLVDAKKEYERIAEALENVRATGYGVVAPTMEEMQLEEPEIIRQGMRFGVRLKASAPSLHMIRVDIKTEVSPIVGTEKQSEELVKYLLSEYESDTKRIWDSNIFGKSLHEIVKEGLNNKLQKMPEDAQRKIRNTLEKIINDGGGGLICIII